MQNTDLIIFNPSPDFIKNCHVNSLMRRLGVSDLQSLWKKSVDDIDLFWKNVVDDVGIEWLAPFSRVSDRSQGIEWTRWFIDGKINICHNCVDRHSSSERDAIVWEGDDGSIRQLTYAEFSTEVSKLSGVLKEFGIDHGDCVGILMPMVPEVVVALFACFKIGAVAIPIFSGFGAEAVGIRLMEAKAKVLLTTDVSFRRGKVISVKENADGACQVAKCIRHRLVLRRHPAAPCPWEMSVDHDWKRAVEKQNSWMSSRRLDAEAPSLILFTSGTTGKPKGTIHTHAGALVQITKELRYAFNCDQDSRFFWFTDIGWMMGPWEMIGVTFFGGTLFIYEGAPDYPTPFRLWEIIERHQLTTLGISPTAIRLLMKYGAAPSTFPMKSLRILGSTGEPWDPASYHWYFEQVGKKRCPIINISGGTEIIGCLLSPLPIQPLKACSLGGPGLGVDADVFDEEGNSVRGGIGHLVCKQPLPSMTKGFLNSTERYLETYFSKFKGVWYHGDWARVDLDGYWFLHGRSDDTIKIAGKRIGPVEYEAALMTVSGVAEAAAIGVPDPLKGETCVCFVVLKPGITADEALKTKCLKATVLHLGKSLMPKEIRFTAALPKTRSAKILRGLIRKVYLGEELTDTSSVENPDSLQSISASH